MDEERFVLEMSGFTRSRRTAVELNNPANPLPCEMLAKGSIHKTT